MGCNCTKITTTSEWVYQAPTGKVTIYANEVQAKAAMIRAGNVGTVRPR